MGPSVTEGPIHRAVGLEAINKRFGPTRALIDVSFEVNRGSVHALLGGNGSGKSTLIKMLAGVHQADSGLVNIGEREYDAAKTDPRWAKEVGFRFVHQDLGVFPTLSVAENVALGRSYSPTFAKSISWKETKRRASELLERWSIAASADQEMISVRPADQAMIAIARAVDLDSNADSAVSVEQHMTLVLDEPTASLPEAEVERLLAWIRTSASEGITTILVTHRLDEVLAIATHVTVLRDGRHLETKSRDEITRRDLVELIVGDTSATVLGDDAKKKTSSRPVAAASKSSGVTPRLRVHGLADGPLRDVSFDLYPGEIVGLAGLLGSGRTRLLHHLAGVSKTSPGVIEIDGAGMNLWPQQHAIRSGIAFVPESREVGIFPGLSVAENLYASHLALRSPFAPALSSEVSTSAAKLVTRFGVKTQRPTSDIMTLSGGNQQKVLMGRWLSIEPRLLLLDEPSVGVDVGARAAVHELIREAASTGATALCVSSDTAELAELCDRVIVLRDGVIDGELTGDDLTAATIGRAIHGTLEGAKS